MTSDFTFFSTVFQSYQDDGRMIMKVCVQWNPIYGLEDFASTGLEFRTAGLVDQCLSHRATRAPSHIQHGVRIYTDSKQSYLKLRPDYKRCKDS